MAHSRLIDVAIREFGAKGLAGASTREIATAADTQMSAITYHFGGKEGLYLAAADAVADHMRANMADAIKASDDHAADITPAEARDVIHALIAAFVDRVANDDPASQWSAFVVREQMRPTAAFDRLYDQAMGGMVENLAELICIATGAKNRRAARVATITLVGQMIAPKMLRGLCRRLLGAETMTGEPLAEVKARIIANADAILDAMIAEQQGADR